MLFAAMLAGFAAGFISALGLGGGGVLVMFLTIFMGFGQLKAQGINLLFFVPVGFFALIWHFRRALVSLRLAVPAVCGGFAGATVGSVLATWLGSNVTGKIFGAMLAVLGFWELLRPSTAQKKKR
ncbi:MAG: TSUP family transporter [Clostridia bacterium]|nr:TSUP family transporter [Clostridia bacterium]